MTFSTTSNRKDYIGNGVTTAFAFPYRFLQDSDLVVIQTDTNGNETTLVLGTGYTVTGAGSYSGGTVTLTTATPNLYTLTIKRIVALTQESSIRGQGAYFPEIHEDAFDKLTMIAQQQEEEISRVIQVPESATGGQVLDAPVEGTVLGWVGGRLKNLAAGTAQLASNLLTSARGYGADLVSYLAPFTGAVGRLLYLKLADIVSIADFGASPSASATANAAAIQAAVTHCSTNNVGLLIPAGEYTINSAITSPGAICIYGEGIRSSRINCEACDGFIFPAGAAKCTVQDLTITQATRYTTTANTKTAIRFNGTTLTQCYWNTVKNVFIDGFGEGVYGGGLCSSVIDNLTTAYTHASVTLTGQCLNNVISNCHFGESESVGSMPPTVGSYGVKVGDGIINCEGCTITNTLIYGVETCVWNYASINVMVDNCILDGVKKYGILSQSTVNAGVANNIYASNYIGISGATGDTGIYLANAYAPIDGQNRGTVVRDNEILAYTGSTLNYGILVDGAEEERNTISGNRVQNCAIRDCKITAGSGHRLSDNIWRDAVGFETTVPVSYVNNVGTSTTAYPSPFGSFTPVLVGTTTPGTGTYSQQLGWYQVIGKLVFFNIRLTWSAHTGTGEMKINGLPVACKNVTGYAPSVSVYPTDIAFPAGATALSAILNTGVATVELRGQGTNHAATPVTMDTSGGLNISGVYEMD